MSVLDLGWRAIMVAAVFLIDAIVFAQLLREELRERRSAVAAARAPRPGIAARSDAAPDQDEEPRREAA